MCLPHPSRASPSPTHAYSCRNMKDAESPAARDCKGRTWWARVSSYCSLLEDALEKRSRSGRGEIEGQYVAMRRRGKSERGSENLIAGEFTRASDSKHTPPTPYTTRPGSHTLSESCRYDALDH